MERIKHKIKRFKVVSLFAGIGGFDIGFGSNWDTKDCGKAESPQEPHCLGTWAEWNTWKDRALRPHRTTQTSIWKVGLGEIPFWVDLKWD